jgi:prepilin-type N-terminal cleavage/methylation domain-containing protein
MTIFKNNSGSKLRGFSLVELMVSVAVVAIITSIVLTNQNQFNSSILLRNLSYDIALSIRQAQVFGLSIRSGFGVNTQGYGVHFDSENDSSYILFADDGDLQFDAGDTVLDTFDIRGGNFVSKFCVHSEPSTEHCSDNGASKKINIVFKRPEPNAIISNENSGIFYERAKVYVSSPAGNERLITVQSSGQITIQ